MNLHLKLADLFSKIVDLMILNILFVLTSLPVITLGASVTALYSVTLRLARDEESSIAKAYFRAFKQNFNLATKGFLLLGLPFVLMILNVLISYGRPEGYMMAVFAISVFFLCVLGICMIYFFPVLARFQFSISQVLQHIPHMIFTHFTAFVIIMGFMGVVAAMFLLKVKAALLMIELSFVILWSLMAYVKSFFFRMIFDSYELDSDESTAKDAIRA